MGVGRQEQLGKALALFHELRAKASSLVLATVGNNGLPNISYAPFVDDEEGDFFVYLSGLSEHTTKLLTNPVAAVMLMEDELDTRQVFARKRITYQCAIEVLDREHPGYERILDAMSERFGNVVTIIRSLPDFYLFRLSPVSGRFVAGFGQAYELSGDDLTQLVHVGVDRIKNA